jgi:predicted glycosyl hydrolase (DUF1957 family)
MYVIKVYRDKLLWKATIFEKEWSEIMLTHEMTELATKRFILHRRCYRWMYKEIGKSLFDNKKLEVIYG